MKKVQTRAHTRAAEYSAPSCSDVTSDPHRVHQPDRSAERPHVLGDIAAEDVHVIACRLANELETIPVGLDVCFGRVVKNGIAEVVVAVVRLRI